MVPVVLIHGGGFDARCWDLLLPHLESPAIAVDLPGRGKHPADLRSVDIAGCAESVMRDIDDAGFGEVVLVGHSMAGCTMPAVIGRLGGRVRHAVFIGCTVSEHGSAILDTLDPAIQEMIRSRGKDIEPAPMDPEMAKVVLGDDLSPEQVDWCVDRMVPEAPGLIEEPVDLGPVAGVSCTWLRTLRDVIVPAEKQLRFAANLDGCEVIDIDAGHMCMVSQPSRTAQAIDAATEV
jgi:pimeloyl-ACP methyl ester carboxylesterase